MDRRQVTRYLDRLYDPGDEVEVLYLAPDGTVRRVARTIPEHPDDYADLLDEMERAETAGFNVYASALPVRLIEARTYDRVWVDQDTIGAPWPFTDSTGWDRPTWPAPTTLVRTSEEDGGFRWQAIWKLRETLTEDEGRDLIARLAQTAGADGSVIDRRRVLRVPGILNAKRGMVARLISTETDPISLEAFNLPTDSTIDKLLAATVSSPHEVLGEWLAGVREGDRSRKAYVTARFLKGCGVTWLDAAAVMKLGALRCSPPLEDRELEHVLDSAYHRKETATR